MIAFTSRRGMSAQQHFLIEEEGPNKIFIIVIITFKTMQKNFQISSIFFLKFRGSGGLYVPPTKLVCRIFIFIFELINFSLQGSRNPEPVCHQLCFRSRSRLEPDPGESFRRQWLSKKGQGLEFRCLERGLDEEGRSAGFVLQRMASSRCFEGARWRRLRKIRTIYCDSIQSNELQNIFKS